MMIENHNAKRKEEIIRRIENLTDEQFQKFMNLLIQQYQESAQHEQASRPA